MRARSEVSVDVLVVSPASTLGWRAAAAELAAGIERAGASVAIAESAPVREVRTFALTDLTQARAARAAAIAGIAEHRPRALIYSSITSALLWPRPGAIHLDAIAAENRPGRHGVWQRPVERRRLAQAPLVLTFAERSLDHLAGPRPPAVLLPSPIDPSPATAAAPRDIDVLAYAADPVKRRLGVVLEAWGRARREGETLVVTGIATLPDGTSAVPGVRLAGRVAPGEMRALMRRARVFVAAPRREDYGIAPLEALADGCVLVTTPSPGPYPARELARELDPRLVTDELPGAIRTALDDPVAGYAERAAALLEPFTRAAVDRTLRDRVLPALLAC